MALGDSWELGVACLIPNHNFRQKAVITGYVNGAHSSLTTSLTIKQLTTVNGSLHTDYLDKVLKRYDEVRIASATASERAFVYSVSGATITLADSRVNTYADNDNVTILVTGLPEYWEPYITSALGVNVLYPIEDADGRFDSYRWAFDTDTTTVFSGIKQTLPDDLFTRANETYRYGFWYKLANGKPLQPRLEDNTELDILGVAAIVGTSTTETTWTRQTYTCIPTNVRTAANNKLAFYRGAADDPKTPFTVQLSDLWLEHAADTSGSANGFYQFSYNPDETSIQIGFLDEPKSVILLNRGFRYYEAIPGAAQNRLHVVSATFSNVSATFRQQLEIFERWQQEDYLLSLHTFLDTLPECLIGRMIIDQEKSTWDKDNSTINFVFEEMA